MARTSVFAWCVSHEERTKLILALSQPMTTGQLAARSGVADRRTSHLIRHMSRHGVVRCLTPSSRGNKVWWLTTAGERIQAACVRQQGTKRRKVQVLQVSWEVYSKVCFRHRMAVMRAVRGRMRVSQIKKQACERDRSLRISDNNVRDVLRVLATMGLVSRTRVKKKVLFELTAVGKEMQQLLASV